MAKEWLMASVISIATLAVSLALLRAFAPGLLGLPVDLQMVAIDEKVPPFFENVFRPKDLTSDSFIINDPVSGVRAKPLVPNQELVGPNDILGFRNHAVPNVADVIVIGDSQTYGINSPMQLNWPGQMSTALNKKRRTTVYNMSVGGWGGVQYLYAATKATALRPRVLIVAFYTGNDPLESFKIAYSYSIWKELIPDPSLSASDLTKVRLSGSESEYWKVRFEDGAGTTFTPNRRYASNANHPAVRAGYAIMARSAQKIMQIAEQVEARAVFTIIPTKELVYEKRVLAEESAPRQDYLSLVAAEKTNIEELEEKILKIEGAVYIDVVGPLQSAALVQANLYPSSEDGHPLPNGYGVIAVAIGKAVESMLPERPRGLAAIDLGHGNYKPVLINREGYWYFSAKSGRTVIEKNGWAINEAPIITPRDIADLEYAGEISDVAPEKFGPQSLTEMN